MTEALRCFDRGRGAEEAAGRLTDPGQVRRWNELQDEVVQRSSLPPLPLSLRIPPFSESSLDFLFRVSEGFKVGIGPIAETGAAGAGEESGEGEGEGEEEDDDEDDESEWEEVEEEEEGGAEKMEDAAEKMDQ